MRLLVDAAVITSHLRPLGQLQGLFLFQSCGNVTGPPEDQSPVDPPLAVYIVMP
jgi:hypothetical protein